MSSPFTRGCQRVIDFSGDRGEVGLPPFLPKSRNPDEEHPTFKKNTRHSRPDLVNTHEFVPEAESHPGHLRFVCLRDLVLCDGAVFHPVPTCEK